MAYFNLFANTPAACVAKQNVLFADAGFDASNTLIIFRVGSPLASWIPGRAINAVNAFEINKGYYIVPKVNMNKSQYVARPFYVMPDDIGYTADYSSDYLKP
jgi:hypothetical protein